MIKKLKPNIAYYLAPVKVFYKTSFSGKQGIRYVFKVHFTDSALDEYIVEYLSLTPEQNIFAEGEFVRFKLESGDDVIASLPGVQQNETEPLEFQFKPIGGETYTFSLSAAKDLVIAEHNNDTGVPRETEDIVDRMFSYAERINKWFENKQIERAVK